MKKLYKVELSALCFEVNVEIDHSFTSANGKTVEQNMQSMIEFWSNAEDRMDDADNDVTIAFLKMLGEKALSVCSYYNYNSTGFIDYMKQAEGWSELDGTWGIKVTYVEDTDLPLDWWEVEEITTEGGEQ